MKSKSLRLSTSFPGILIGTLLLLMVGCNNQPVDQVSMDKGEMNKKADSNKMVSWLGLKVEFKPNINAEMKDRSIRAVESIIMDSVKTLRQKFPAFSPTICVGKSFFVDSQTYTVNTMYPLSVAASLPDTTCLCKNQCGICRTMMNLIIHSGDPAFQSIKRISDMDQMDYFH